MAAITNDWLPALKEEFSKDYYKKLFEFVKDEYSKTVVYPPSDDSSMLFITHRFQRLRC